MGYPSLDFPRQRHHSSLDPAKQLDISFFCVVIMKSLIQKDD